MDRDYFHSGATAEIMQIKGDKRVRKHEGYLKEDWRSPDPEQ